MPDQHSSQLIREALAAIIEGKFVTRNKHALSYEGSDLTDVFIEKLKGNAYIPTTVNDVRVEPGERVPAFFIEHRTAYFGWVFWEQFTTWKLRKLWGSVIKNKLGDWEIQIPANRPTTIYANESLRLEMDIDHPPEF
jgi:hypothetical protein